MEYMDTWLEMVKLLKAGKVKAIGVSNFTIEQLKTLMAGSSGVVPAINQVSFAHVACTVTSLKQRASLSIFLQHSGIHTPAVHNHNELRIFF